MAMPGNQRNNSDQMRDLLSPEFNSGNWNKSDENSGKNKLSSAGCSSSSASSSSSSSAASSNKAKSKQSDHDSSKVNDKVPENHNAEIYNKASCSSSTSFSSSPSSSSAPSHGGAAKPQIEFDYNSEKCNTEKDEWQRENISKENSSQADFFSTSPSSSSSSSSTLSTSSSSSSSSSSTSSSSEPSSSEAVAKHGHHHDEDSYKKNVIREFDPFPTKSNQEKYEHDRENDVKQSSNQAGCSCSCSCSCSSSVAKSSGAGSPGHLGEDEPMDTSQEDSASSCCQLDDLKRLPQCTNQLGRLKFSRRHTVLINVDVFNTEGNLLPQEGTDVWSSDVVKMPCSRHSFMETQIRTGLTRQLTKVRRWEVITEQLGGLSKKTHVRVRDVEEAIMKYNPKYAGQWSFDALSAFVKSTSKMENYFPTLVPKIAALALKLPKYVKKPIPLLQKKQTAMITLSQVQISCLLANAFFCTFPHRNTTSSKAEYGSFPTINFSSLFGNGSERKKEKLRAIMHYFNVVTDEKTKPKGLVTFERRCLEDMNKSDWRSCKDRMPKLHVTSNGTIETEGKGMLQVDFASSWIGGGVLSSGLVQEEILFLINPELIVSRLFTEKLEDNECLIITGSQRFSHYLGFGDSFEWIGSYEETLPRDQWKRLKRQILVIDALHFRHKMDQYSMRKVMRELNKAYCGFKGQEDDEPDIATGKWGCGAFNGDPQLKAVIQLMAAAKAKRGLAFFTFEDEELEKDLQKIHHLLVTEKTTVGALFRLLEDFCVIQQQTDGSNSLFKFIRNNIGPFKSQL